MTKVPPLPPVRPTGVWYALSFDEIRRAYRATRDSQRLRARDAEAHIRQAYDLGDGPLPETDYDESGAFFDFNEAIGDEVRDAESVLGLIRPAFLIALFHFWERNANRWAGVTHYRHPEMMAALAPLNLSLDTEGLLDLSLAANTLKHGLGSSATQLFARRKDLFDPTLVASPGFEPSDDSLLVTDETLEAFFEIVRRSGPQPRTPWR